MFFPRIIIEYAQKHYTGARTFYLVSADFWVAHNFFVTSPPHRKLILLPIKLIVSQKFICQLFENLTLFYLFSLFEMSNQQGINRNIMFPSN